MHSFSTTWKDQKTVRFSNVFKGYRKGALGTNGLKIIWIFVLSFNSLRVFLKLGGQIYNRENWNIYFKYRKFDRFENLKDRPLSRNFKILVNINILKFLKTLLKMRMVSIDFVTNKYKTYRKNELEYFPLKAIS